jgi:chemotaxis protein methyltransferase CheR
MSEALLLPEAVPVWVRLHDWVERHSGIVLAGGRSESFRIRVEALCQNERATPEQMLTRLERGDARVAMMIADAATTNYTQLFREREAFQLLADQVYPTLDPGPVRMWSAATSTGEEAYSLAIHAAYNLGPGTFGRVKVLGTDLSARHIETAEAGVYETARMPDLTPGERLAFEPLSDSHWRVRPPYRDMCTFRRLNLLAPHWPFTQAFHVIFCRNVLYYFDSASRHRVLEAMYDVTAAGGWLITSFTDPTSDVRTRWSSVQPGVFRRDPI